INNTSLTNNSQTTYPLTNRAQPVSWNSGLNLSTMPFSGLSGQMHKLTDTSRTQSFAAKWLNVLETYNRALPISQVANDKVAQAVTHASIAQTYLAVGEGRQALEHYNHAFHVGHELNDLKLQIMAKRGMGAAHLTSGETELALDAYRDARIL